MLCDMCGENIQEGPDDSDFSIWNEVEITDREDIMSNEKYHVCDSCLASLRDTLGHALDGVMKL